ncbi:hypothetical protein KC19_1G298900 [Ceratodon purpureus]|uniref:C-terminal of Roc (COR) domain-containing protein n=1 Tax=Ceratodon purpureus TaxID=3225 RepID=A0A8T0JAT2_CERPU|nr:hypothetical protein KC19_1G298900 [Ceratodon purpureus]
MAGSSPGTSVKPPSLGGERSGARKACPSPCNRRCAPLECTFELPKSIHISVKQHEVREMKSERNGEVGNKEVNSTLSVSDEGTKSNESLVVWPKDRDGNWGNAFELSLSNFVRTISSSSQVEEVSIGLDMVSRGASQETSRALVECMKTIPSLKSLHLKNIGSSGLSVSDAEAIFSAFGPHSTLQTGGVDFADLQPTEAAIVKVLVDALLQNQVLRHFKLSYYGLRTMQEGHEGSVMRELNEYLKSPTNVLTELIMWAVDDGEVIQLADALGLNKNLQQLGIGREYDSSHCEGIGRIGEALRTNSVLEELHISGLTRVGVEEMEALVGALVPDAASGLQPNTHLHTLRFQFFALEGKKGMKQLATLLETNTSLLHFYLERLNILKSGSENVVEYVEMLFTALRCNTSLKSLDLTGCNGIGGKDVLGMIMDMLLHNRSLKEIKLKRTRLEEDGDAEVVYAELRGRDKTIDEELEKVIQKMDRVPPNSARVFLCGNPKGGKTTLCQRWEDIQLLSNCETKGGQIHDDKLFKLSSHGKDNNRTSVVIPKWLTSKFSVCFKPSISAPSSGVLEPTLPSSAHDLPPSSSIKERTRGIEVHKMVWEDMNMSLWDLAGQEEYHTFHDMMLPNRSPNGDCCFYFIVCNPTNAIQRLYEKEPMQQLKRDIYYWLVFIASNTRRSKSYLPHVSILMTHYDLWGVDKEKEMLFKQKIKPIINKFRNKFQLFLEFDEGLEFIEMENTSRSSSDAMELKQHVLQYLKKISLELPKILKASVDFQSTIMKWRGDSSKEPFVKWDVFSNSLSQEVMEFRSLKDVGPELLEKIKKRVAVSLHNGGHIMYFEEIDVVILNPHWFCQNIIGHILFHCSELNDQGAIAANGIISWQDFKELVVDGDTMCGGHFEEILKIMTKLQICYEDGDESIMIPSLLDGSPIPTNWEEVFGSLPEAYTYVGLKLKTADESITKLTRGFFPRLQVYLRDKFRRAKTYRLYSNTKTLSLFTKGISLIVDGVELFILLDMEDSINIISRCCGGGGSENRRVLKMMIDCVNDFRQTPTLGCPGVIFEEHVIYPYSVENALGAKKLQCISKKQLREEVVDKILRKGDFTYTLDWVDEKGVSRYVHAKELFEEKEWLDILQRRSQKVMDMDKVLDSRLSAKNSNAPAASIRSNNDLVRKDSTKRFIADEIDSLKRLMQHNHKEVMTRLDELEKNIMGFQEKLTSRVCSNIDNLMECLLQLNNSNIPKLPFFTKSAGRGGKRILLKMVPGLKSYELQFMCEHRDGFHILKDQPGCEVEIGNDQTRKFGIVMYWGLTMSVILLKVGAHVTAGMGSMVPDLTREFATILDSPGLLDLAQPRGDILDCLPEELKKQPHINLQDNEEAKAWLVQILGKKCPGGIQRLFKLTPMVYTSKFNQKGGMAWLCDEHRDKGEQDGSLRRR